MSIPLELSGQTYGRWTVLQRVRNSEAGVTMWLCECSCGTQRPIKGHLLTSGRSKSCGCLKAELTTKRSTKHGAATAGITPTYSTWAAMKARCLNPNHSNYRYYGGAGITVCKKWLKFEGFLEDMGEKPPGMTLERRDNTKGYYKENCVWASRKVQANNRDNNNFITVRGKTKTLQQWADEIGISKSTLRDRLAAGWSKSEAVSIPGGVPTDNAKSRMLTYRGKTKCVAEWARELGLRPATIAQRLSRGATDEQALRPIGK